VLVTSTEPCCQCFGAIVWSGITKLVCGATTSDAEAIGFDEGPKPDRWDAVLEARGISVERAVCRAEAIAVLQKYAAQGHPIYGPGRTTSR
jgi:tRNA(Arg) A34 adenosine deaminase TadA